MTEEVTEEALRSRWSKLAVSADFFANCKKHAINYILAENYERKLYCFECESIEFQNEKGERIWTTAGDGQMDMLPANIGVYIVRGKSRTA
ncbi:uncharacterized protein CIMG_08250 [Coccidioides immitis RS]|uniref:Uncharacterized protein n=2 Tax=Coccidioides TaxID=5500 RepID=J3K542_COCIM|nr:uncharacterized protein CIMG_08250 [Coccidioides immitis RS]EAS29504.3 hypothetical protein CIMG_08250 [Coccidioides immitis RS]KMM68938.1 hypothetical protein CPAG_05261 [Coccidioides posadasii RMSCC 3488]